MNMWQLCGNHPIIYAASIQINIRQPYGSHPIQHSASILDSHVKAIQSNIRHHYVAVMWQPCNPIFGITMWQLCGSHPIQYLAGIQINMWQPCDSHPIQYATSIRFNMWQPYGSHSIQCLASLCGSYVATIQPNIRHHYVTAMWQPSNPIYGKYPNQYVAAM